MLPLSDKFKTSFNSKHNSVFPIVVISKLGTFTQSDELVYLSQNAKNFNFLGIGQDQYFEDFGLHVSDISESIDVFDRSFQTNSVTVSVSNYVIKNKRFTERFNTEFTGYKCRIYYANIGITNVSDCPIVFEGFIRNYTINHEMCEFDIEDESQYLQDSNNFPKRRTLNADAETIDTNKWLYYPVVYGENERSRLLFSRPQINNLISKIFPDANYQNSDINVLGFQNTESTLKILRDGMYLDVPRVFQDVPEDLIINGYNYSRYIGLDQYEITDQQIVLEKKISDHTFTNGMPLNIQARDQFQIDASRPATGVRATSTDEILKYGNVSDGSGDIQEIEYQGHLNGYGVSSGGGEFFFPTPDDDGIAFAGYYENQLISRFVRRYWESNWWSSNINGIDAYWDSGSFHVLNRALHLSTEYEETETPGAYELYKNLPEDPNELKRYFNLPGLRGDWSAKYIYCWVSAGSEYDYRVSSEFPDGSVWNTTKTARIYPSRGLVDGGIGPVQLKSQTHPSLYQSIDNDSSFGNGASPLGQGYYRAMGVRFKRISTDGSDNEHQLLNQSWRFLFDNPIDYDAEQQALQDFYASKFTHGEGQWFQYNEDPTPTAPAIVFREGFDGQDSATIAQQTLQLGGTWTSSDGTQKPYIRQIGGEQNISTTIGLMDWLKDENGDWEETPTLRKLLFGRRVTDDDYIETGLPLGTWVYGCLPILGYCKPKTSILTHQSDSSGGNYYYQIAQDSLYAYLNPLLEALAVFDNSPTLTNRGQDAGLTNYSVNWDLSPSIFEQQFPDYIEDLENWRNENLIPFSNWLNEGKDLTKLKKYNVVSHPDEALSNYAIGWFIGIHEDFGSDFGPIYGRLHYWHTGNRIYIHPRVEYKGVDAFRGGNYVPIAYTQGQKKAVKLDLTFNSISGNDVIQGSNYARFVLNMTTELYLRFIDTPTDHNNYNVDFLVECDAFKNIEGKNNVIEVKKINANLDTTSIDENQEPTVTYKFRTGHPEDQPVDENGNTMYSMGTLATSTDLETDPNDFYTIKSRCDFFEPESDDDDQEDTWMQNVNSVNNVSLTYHIGQDPKKTDFSDHDPINGEYQNPTIPQNIDGGIITQIHRAEIQQRFIVGNVSQQEYYAHVKGRIDDWNLAGAESDGVDEAGNPIIWVRGVYTGKLLNLNNINDDWLIKNPADTLMHLIDKEFSYSLPEKDEASITAARENHENWEFDFTISKETDPVEFLEDFCKSTMFCARMRYDGTFGYINLFRSVQDGADKIINSSDIIDFKITKTPKEKLFLKVRVSYDYDEGLDSYQKSTNLDGGGAVPANLEQYMQMYNVKNVENHYLDFESKFIKNSDTAVKLRNQLLSYYKNRHNVFEVTLPHTYLDLECGDIVEFSDLVQGVQIFGLDYTQPNLINGQIITQYFVVTELVKSSDSVQLKLLQQHAYDENFIEEEPTYNFLYNIENVIIDAEDTEDTEDTDVIVYELGDVNFDGFVNVLDIVTLTLMVVGGNESDVSNGDFNQDGFINVLDIVAIVQNIVDG